MRVAAGVFTTTRPISRDWPSSALSQFQPVITELHEQALPDGYLEYLRAKFRRTAAALPNDAQRKLSGDC
jgi:hypothetical protein